MHTNTYTPCTYMHTYVLYALGDCNGFLLLLRSAALQSPSAMIVSKLFVWSKNNSADERI